MSMNTIPRQAGKSAPLPIIGDPVSEAETRLRDIGLSPLTLTPDEAITGMLPLGVRPHLRWRDALGDPGAVRGWTHLIWAGRAPRRDGEPWSTSDGMLWAPCLYDPDRVEDEVERLVHAEGRGRAEVIEGMASRRFRVTASMIAACPWAYAEIDHLDIAEQWRRMRALEEATGLTWSMVVFSGRKSLHAYLSYREPLAPTSPLRLEIQRLLAVCLEGDTKIVDPGRWMRLPGWRSQERVQPVVRFSPDARFDGAEVRDRLRRYAAEVTGSIDFEGAYRDVQMAEQLAVAARHLGGEAGLEIQDHAAVLRASRGRITDADRTLALAMLGRTTTPTTVANAWRSQSADESIIVADGWQGLEPGRLDRCPWCGCHSPRVLSVGVGRGGLRYARCFREEVTRRESPPRLPVPTEGLLDALATCNAEADPWETYFLSAESSEEIGLLPEAYRVAKEPPEATVNLAVSVGLTLRTTRNLPETIPPSWFMIRFCPAVSIGSKEYIDRAGQNGTFSTDVPFLSATFLPPRRCMNGPWAYSTVAKTAGNGIRGRRISCKSSSCPACATSRKEAATGAAFAWAREALSGLSVAETGRLDETEIRAAKRWAAGSWLRIWVGVADPSGTRKGRDRYLFAWPQGTPDRHLPPPAIRARFRPMSPEEAASYLASWIWQDGPTLLGSRRGTSAIRTLSDRILGWRQERKSQVLVVTLASPKEVAQVLSDRLLGDVEGSWSRGGYEMSHAGVDLDAVLREKVESGVIGRIGRRAVEDGEISLPAPKTEKLLGQGEPTFEFDDLLGP